ncbi:hypothetical protein B0H13DRAFT_1853116 [Mycena leptocephala]|nr:hypothetical protein B0H13DRAFT_1853116 [Mycena leptocephala]
MAGPQKKDKAPAPKRAPAKPPARKRVPTAKEKAQAKKKKGDDSDSSEDSSDEIIIDETVSKTGVEVDWSNDPDLSVRLPAIISEDADIKRMAKTIRDFRKEMGETGAGIQNAADINTDVTNKFTTKWGTYLYPNASCTR